MDNIEDIDFTDSPAMPTSEQVAEFKESLKTSEYELFTTDQFIDNCGFVDFVFLGEHAGQEVLWNACITTGDGDYFQIVTHKHLDEGTDKFPSKHEPFSDEYFKPIEGTDLVEWIDPDPEQSEKKYRWVAEQTMATLAERSFEMVFWSIELDEDYKYGIGLHIMMDIEWINVDDVNTFITEFTSRGLDVFNDKDLVPKSRTAEELKVSLDDDAMFIRWDRGCKDTVALTIGMDDD